MRVEAQERSIPLDQIQRDPNQVRRRRSDAKLDQLKNAIARHGLLHPIGVRRTGDRQYQLIYGEGRLIAAGLLGWDRIQARVWDGVSEADLHAMGVVENDADESLAEADRAIAYERQVEVAGGVKAAAQQLGIHEKSLHRTLSRNRRRREGQSVNVAKVAKVGLSTVRDRLRQLSDPSATPHWKLETRDQLVEECERFIRRWAPERFRHWTPALDDDDDRRLELVPEPAPEDERALGPEFGIGREVDLRRPSAASASARA